MQSICKRWLWPCSIGIDWITLGGKKLDLTLLMETTAVASFGFHPIQWIGQLLGVIMDGIFRVTSAVGIMNIGLCIIIFTILVNVIMIHWQSSFVKITKIDGEVATARNSSHSKKYKGKQDQQSLARQQAETRQSMKSMAQYGRWLSSLVIQLPILFGLYRVIYNIPAYVPSVKGLFFKCGQCIDAAGRLCQSDYRFSKGCQRCQLSDMIIPGVNHLINLLYKC